MDSLGIREKKKVLDTFQEEIVLHNSAEEMVHEIDILRSPNATEFLTEIQIIQAS
jgi:hypothetical protein